MSKHATEWLNAYLDGELHGNRLHQVEEHLAECKTCQAELETLQGLSRLLHEVHAPEFRSPDRFAAQVNLLLPQRQLTPSRRKILEVGWWMVPIGLLTAWVFISTSFFVDDILSTANRFGLLSSVSDWIVFGSSSNATWSATLGQLGILSGNTLNWAESTEAFTKSSLLQISLQVSIAMLYLSWIAIWWTRHRRQGRGQPLES